MVLTDLERHAGAREFALRTRGKVIVFRPPDEWWMYMTDQRGRVIDNYHLAFADVERFLSDQPNALSDARRLVLA